MLLAVALFELYLFLPPGIPFITSFGLIPLRLRLTNYAMVVLIAYGLYAFGFTVIESLIYASVWMTLAVYLIFDILYGVPLTV